MGWRPELFNFHPWNLGKSLHLPGLQFSYLWSRMTKLAQSSPDFDVIYKYRKQKQDEGSMHPVIINNTSLAYLTELFWKSYEVESLDLLWKLQSIMPILVIIIFFLGKKEGKEIWIHSKGHKSQ